jgi:hypothetical protein
MTDYDDYDADYDDSEDSLFDTVIDLVCEYWMWSTALSLVVVVLKCIL